MYTEKSIELKSDFYSRFGETQGRLFFERTGLPCKILGGDEEFMAFSFDCGVRAYGRYYGDILRVMDSDSNVCDVHFVKGGKGAQILYKKDMENIGELSDTVTYTVNKLLRVMGCNERLDSGEGIEAVCDRYGDRGWCAVKVNGEFKSVPLPMGGYNVVLIRTRKRKMNVDGEIRDVFERGESDRIQEASEGLRKCGLEAFFNAINESQASIERMLNPSRELISAVEAARNGEGVCAVRICDLGVVAFVKRSNTDTAVHSIINECSKSLGYAVRVAVVK